MTSRTDRILVVEDEDELRALLAELLTDAGFDVVTSPRAQEALALLADPEIDLVITDLLMPGMRGEELLEAVRAERPDVSVIVITAFGSIESAIELVKAGAYDYLPKPFGADELVLVVERALSESRLRREVARLQRGQSGVPEGFVGSSRPMAELYEMIARVAPSNRPVLITGESGTGKELVARAVHAASGRGPFVPVNCSAVPKDLMESELFGYERGAFTGAARDKPGLIEAADGGTLFLDEIGELALELQPKLLRCLEDGEVRRLGTVKATPVDVRVLAATHCDLDVEVAEGRFREDLYWRINVVTLTVPPLRERLADIPLLAEHFLTQQVAGERSGGSDHPERPSGEPRRLSARAMALLVSYSWPGNVRELRNAIERAALLVDGSEVRPDDLPERVREAGTSRLRVQEAAERTLPLQDLERAYIEEMLVRTGGNRTRAAALLGVDRKTLYRKLEEYKDQDARSSE